MAGIYVHIPFCRSRCLYCGFYSTTNLDLRQRYVDTLFKEMQLRRDYIQAPFSTVYIGGGTPSVLDPKWMVGCMNQIRACFSLAENAEITIEINPGTLSADKVAAYKRAGINRFSIGLHGGNCVRRLICWRTTGRPSMSHGR